MANGIDAIIARIESVTRRADAASRDMLLSEKTRLLDEVFAKAEQKLNSLSEEDYVSFLSRSISSSFSLCSFVILAIYSSVSDSIRAIIASIPFAMVRYISELVSKHRKE